MVEQLSYTQRVGGSNPSGPTMNSESSNPVGTEVDLETAKKIVKGRKTYTGVILIAMWVVVGIIVLTVWPKLKLLYDEMGMEVPKMWGMGVEQWMIAGMVVTAVVAAPLFFGRWEENLEKKVDEQGRMGKIQVGDIPGRILVPLIIMILGLMVGLLVMAIIGPIYNITSKV